MDIELKELKELRKIRKEQKIKIVQLSKRTGISRNLIARIESGNGNPSFDNVKRIAEALGLKLMVIRIKE